MRMLVSGIMTGKISPKEWTDQGGKHFLRGEMGELCGRDCGLTG